MGLDEGITLRQPLWTVSEGVPGSAVFEYQRYIYIIW